MRRLLAYLPAQRAKSAREHMKWVSSSTRQATPAARAVSVTVCSSRHSPGSIRLSVSGLSRCNCSASRPTSVGASLSPSAMYSTSTPRSRSASRKCRIADRNSAMRDLWLQTCAASPGASIINTRSAFRSKSSSAGLSRLSWSPKTSTSLRTPRSDVAPIKRSRRQRLLRCAAAGGSGRSKTSPPPNSLPRHAARSLRARTARKACWAATPYCHEMRCCGVIRPARSSGDLRASHCGV